MSRPALPRSPKSKDLSLKWLELFQICAQKGTLQAASEETGLTVSTISHHLRSLEDHLGVALFNHTRRPMILTPKGQVFLRNIDGALSAIRKAKAEASAGNVTEASYLRIGSIDDLNSDITPELAVFLSQFMPNCDFLYQTDTSGEIIKQLHNRHLDLGITASPSERLRDLQERPLLRDPFVLVVPKNTEITIDEIIEGRSALPFLRFSNTLYIGRQIEAQLRRLGFTGANRFECTNSQTLMAMVAAGAGWTIMTPLLFARSHRFQPKLKMYPFPGRSFARTLSLISTPDCSASITDLFDAELRKRITHHAIAPYVDQNPWLKDSYKLVL